MFFSHFSIKKSWEGAVFCLLVNLHTRIRTIPNNKTLNTNFVAKSSPKLTLSLQHIRKQSLKILPPMLVTLLSKPVMYYWFLINVILRSLFAFYIYPFICFGTSASSNTFVTSPFPISKIGLWGEQKHNKILGTKSFEYIGH